MVEDSDKSNLAKRIQMRRIGQSMDKAQGSSKRQLKDYGDALIEFLRDNGQILCISADNSFSTLLRDLVTQTLKMPLACLTFSSKPEMIGKLVRTAVANGKQPVAIIDQHMNGRDLAFVTKVIKNAYPELKILMLVGDTDKHRFVLLHESGVDACLVKPLDTNGLLEKISLAVKPNEQVDRAIAMARALLGKGEYMPALQVCTQALEQQNNSSNVLLLMGDIFKAMKEWDKAVDAYTKASAGSSLYLEPLRRLADLYGEKGDISRQIDFLEKLDAMSPLNLERKIQIGELALKLKQPEKARKIFDQAMKLSNREARENIASVAYRVADLYTDSDPVTAAQFLQRGLDARKEFWSHEDLATFNRLGLLLRRAGKWEEACASYQKALTVAPNDDSLYYNLSMAYLEGKDMENARASALKAMALNPDLPRRSSRVASNLAAVFMNTNDKMHALPLLRTALELDPSNEQARELVKAAENDPETDK